MPKPMKTKKSEADVAAQKSLGKEAGYLFLPWSCSHYPGRSEIEAYIPGRDWEAIAEVLANPGVDAELIAKFIVQAVNSYEMNRGLISQMISALELCLACEGKLTWEAEQEAQAVLTRSKKMI